MLRPSFSLRSLLLAVAFIGAACATLRYPNEWVAGTWLIATPLILLLATLGAVVRKAERRAFWLGFAIFGWGYLLLSGSQFGQQMLTARLFRLFYFKLYPDRQFYEEDDPFGEADLNFDSRSDIRNPPEFVLAQWVPQTGRQGATVERWIPSLRSYLALGRAIFTLLIAWLGGHLGKLMAASENSRPTPPTG